MCLASAVLAYGAELLPLAGDRGRGTDNRALSLTANAEGYRAVVRVQQLAVLAALVPLEDLPADVLAGVGVDLAGALQNEDAAHLEATRGRSGDVGGLDT